MRLGWDAIAHGLLEHDRETIHAITDLVIPNARVAEEECWWQRPDSQRRQRQDVKPRSLGRPGRGDVVETTTEPAHDRHAGIGGADIEQSAQPLSREIHQEHLTLVIDRAHAPDVPLEMSLDDEVGHHRLLEEGRMNVDEVS